MCGSSPTTLESLVAIMLTSRPPAWCFGPILFGMGLIHSRSMSKEINKSISLLTGAAQVVALSFPLCVIVFGMNDVYDYHSDIKNTRKLRSGLEGGVLFPVYHASVRLAAYLSTILIFAASLITLNAHNMSATFLLTLIGWQYSASPLRLKEVPLLDSCSNGLIIFLAWLVGYTFGHGRLSGIPDNVYILSLCTTGVHALGAAVDVESDMAAGQTTIATYFGHIFAVAFGASMFIASLITVNGSNIIVNIYLWGGTVIMFSPCLQISWAHHAFKTVVFWSVGMVLVWFGSKAIAWTPFRNRTLRSLDGSEI